MLVYIAAFFTPVILGGELRAVSWPLLRKFAVMGGIDCCCTLIVIMAAPHVAGPVQILLMQGVLPATLLATRIAFGRRYLWVHYLGAAIIVIGILFSILDPSTDDHAARSGSKPSSASNEPQSHRMAIVWGLFFFSFNIPAAISSVYKEWVFKTSETEISINLLNAWVSFFQFFFGLLFVPVVAPLEDTAFSDIPANFGDGAVCLFAHRENRSGDYCAGYTTIVVFLCLFCNVAWNVFILLIIKNATASLMFVANTLTIPLANLGFAVPFVVAGGPTPRSRITWEGIMALVVTLAGLAVYQTKAEPEDEATAPSPPPPKDHVNTPLLAPSASPLPLPPASGGSINASSTAPRAIGFGGTPSPSANIIASPLLVPSPSGHTRTSSSVVARSFGTRFGGASFTGLRMASTPTSGHIGVTGATPGSPGDAVWRPGRTYSQF